MSGTLGEVTRRVVADLEARKIAQALKEADGDRSRTADALQISYKMLVAKLKEYGIES